MDSPSAGAVTEADLVALAAKLQEVSLRRGLTLALAESCTGGLIAHAITEVDGSSGYFRGAVVAYHNDIKEADLGVPREVLAAHGAVSAQTARAMATGVRDRFKVDVAASVTGIAGRGGGSPAKPVGLTYVGVADARGADVRRFVWTGNRSANKLASAAAVLELLIERLEVSDAK